MDLNEGRGDWEGEDVDGVSRPVTVDGRGEGFGADVGVDVELELANEKRDLLTTERTGTVRVSNSPEARHNHTAVSTPEALKCQSNQNQSSDAID